jgi:trigger factor
MHLNFFLYYVTLNFMSNTQKEENKDSGIEVKELEHSEVEINGEIPTEEFEKHREDALKSFAQKAEVAGFRKGHIPEKVIEDKFGEVAILEEMAQHALSQKYPEILQEKSIDAIGQPEISITKLAKGSPLGYKIKTAVMPEIILPDYKKLAKESTPKEEKVEITEKEVDEVITHIRTQRKQMEANKGKEEEKEGEDGKEHEKEDTSEEKPANAEKKTEELPPLTDEIAKELGFEGIEDLKKIIRENLRQEKETRGKDENRAKMIDVLLEKTSVDLPTLVVDNELERMMAQLKGEIANMGLTFEQYLEHVKKTEEDLKQASRPDAEKRAKSQLVINKIAVEENIEADKDKLEKEVAQLKEKYEDADDARTRAYVEMVLTNEAVLEFLEGNGGDKKEEEDSSEEGKKEK